MQDMMKVANCNTTVNSCLTTWAVQFKCLEIEQAIALEQVAEEGLFIFVRIFGSSEIMKDLKIPNASFYYEELTDGMYYSTSIKSQWS